MTSNNIITEIDIQGFQSLLEKAGKEHKLVIAKFTATWCGPCRRVKPLTEYIFSKLQNDVILLDIDIDETMDLYIKLQSKKMLKGVPSILAWFPNPEREKEHWYVNDESISGSDKENIKQFFSICLEENNLPKISYDDFTE